MSTSHLIDEGTNVVHEAASVSVPRLTHRAPPFATFHQPLDGGKADGDQIFHGSIARPGTELPEQHAQNIGSRASIGDFLHFGTLPCGAIP
jgi:hypothetical protein